MWFYSVTARSYWFSFSGRKKPSQFFIAAKHLVIFRKKKWFGSLAASTVSLSVARTWTGSKPGGPSDWVMQTVASWSPANVDILVLFFLHTPGLWCIVIMCNYTFYSHSLPNLLFIFIFGTVLYLYYLIYFYFLLFLTSYVWMFVVLLHHCCISLLQVK